MFILLLAGIVLICTAAIMPALWDVAKEVAKREAVYDPRQCLVIRDNGDRLKCLEQRVGQRPSPPAKGAFAPLGAFEKRDEAK